MRPFLHVLAESPFFSEIYHWRTFHVAAEMETARDVSLYVCACAYACACACGLLILYAMKNLDVYHIQM